MILFAVYGNVGRYVIYNPFITASAHDVSFSDYFFTRVKYVICLLVFAYGAAVPIRRGYSFDAVVNTLPFLIWATLSAFWSVDTGSTLRGSIQLFGFCVAVAVLAARIGPARLASCCIGVVAVACIASAVAAVVFPHVGRHQTTDVLQSTHAGLWRGIMGHKNLLGPYAALGSVLLFTSHRLLNFPFWLLWMARLSAIACFVFSGNATAIPEVVSMIAIYFCFRTQKLLTPSGILIVFVGLIGAVLMVTMLAGLVAEVLGRDPTFSGRTIIWARSIGVWLEHGPLIGSGYSASTSVLAPILTRELFRSATSAHSGYISMLLDVGATGLALFCFALFANLSIGLKTMKSVRMSTPTGSLYFDAKLAMLLALCGNLVGAIAEPSALEIFGVGYITFAALVILGSDHFTETPSAGATSRIRPSTSTGHA